MYYWHVQGDRGVAPCGILGLISERRGAQFAVPDVAFHSFTTPLDYFDRRDAYSHADPRAAHRVATEGNSRGRSSGLGQRHCRRDRGCAR